MQPRPISTRRNRRKPWAGLATVGVLLVSVGSLASCHHDDGTPASGPDRDRWTLVAGRMVPVPRPGGASGSVVPLTDGTFLLLDGGTSPRSGSGRPGPRAQRFDPRTGTWREAAIPTSMPLSPPAAVATATGVLVVGARCRHFTSDGSQSICQPGGLAGFTLDRGSGRWRKVDLPRQQGAERDPRDEVQLLASPDGEQVFADLGGDPYRFSPQASRWTRVDPDPTAQRDGRCATDDGLVDISTSDHRSRVVSAGVLDEDGTWSEHPNTLPARRPASIEVVVCSARSAIVVGEEPTKGTVYAYRFTQADGAWEQLEGVPRRLGVPEGAAIDGGAIVANADGHTYVFRDRDRRWSRATLDLGKVTAPTIGPDGTFLGYTLAKDGTGSLQPTLQAARLR